jgi:hypothetical protein
MGYIGGSPKFPRTAFSIRLLRFHHKIWKHSATPILPFAKGVDEFLDAFDPLILIPNRNQELVEAFNVSFLSFSIKNNVGSHFFVLIRLASGGGPSLRPLMLSEKCSGGRNCWLLRS